ncbi:hypothetical protein F5878DRAFT_668904, partial [Lentinula raphanica]
SIGVLREAVLETYRSTSRRFYSYGWGHTKKDIEKLCDPFINRSRQLYEARQLCGFGWLIDPVSAQAIPWGGDPLYLAMRNANPAQITTQAIDYGSMFHNQLMVQNQDDVGLDPVKQALVNRFLEEGNNKEVLRALLKDILLMSLREIHPHNDIKQMKWGPAFADMCYLEKVKLVNYPPGLKAIGPPGGITGAALIPVHHLKTMVKQHVRYWQQEVRKKKSTASREHDITSLFDDDEDDEDNDNDNSNSGHKVFLEDLVRFVPWDDEEKQFSLKHQANIPILLEKPQGNDDPLPLTRVLHSNIFLNRAAARQIKIDLPKEMRKEGEASDQASDGGDSDDEVMPKKSRNIRQSRTEDRDSREEETVSPLRKPRRKIMQSWPDDRDSSGEETVPLRKSRQNTGSGSRGEPKLKKTKRILQTRVQDSDSSEDAVPAGHHNHQPQHAHRSYGDASDVEGGEGLRHQTENIRKREQRPLPRPRMIPPGQTRTVAKGPALSSDEAEESDEERPKKRVRLEKKEQSRKRKRGV